MWFVLLQLQPWNGLLESGRKQKISDLDPTFHALYTIIHQSHRGHAGPTEAENGIALGDGVIFMGNQSRSWRTPAMQSPLWRTLSDPGARAEALVIDTLPASPAAGVHLCCPQKRSAPSLLLGCLLHGLSPVAQPHSASAASYL